MALLQKITYEDAASCECSLPYVSKVLLRKIIYQNKVFCGFSSAYLSNVSTTKFCCSVAYTDRVPCCVGHLSQISHELRGCCAENNIKIRYPVSCRHPISNVYTSKFCYVVASGIRIDKIIGLFCKRAPQKRRYSAKEMNNFIDPTNRSHPIQCGEYP